MKKSLFNNDTDETIIKFMQEWGHIPNAYKKISKEIPQYTAKQIRQRWKNHLDPSLCHDKLHESEQTFVVQWVKANQESPDGKIHWKNLIGEIESKFGNLHPENKVKNFWYAKKRSEASKEQATLEDEEMMDISEEDMLIEDENGMFSEDEEELEGMLSEDGNKKDILPEIENEEDNKSSEDRNEEYTSYEVKNKEDMSSEGENNSYEEKMLINKEDISQPPSNLSPMDYLLLVADYEYNNLEH